MRIYSTLLGAAAAAISFTAVAGAQSPDEAMAAAVAASVKYKDVNTALAAGFVPDPSGCISAAAEGLPPEWGGMGVHYLNMAKLQITGGDPLGGNGIHTDFNDPAILMYEPQADGSMVLVAVENLVFQAAWSAAGNSEPPSFAGVVWDAMADDPATEASESHGFAPHFDRHFWAYRDNPAGPFVPFNPAVSCEFG